MTNTENDVNSPKFLAVVDLIRRTGSVNFQLRYQDDEPPIVWIAIAGHFIGPDGFPVPKGDEMRYEAAASLDPFMATVRLAEQLIDGGYCMHCQRPTGLEPDSLEEMPLDTHVCWYQYDPELNTFRRGCE